MYDNYDAWRSHDDEQQRQLERLPVCMECDEHIQEEYCYEFNGEYLCLRCLIEHHRVSVDELCC